MPPQVIEGTWEEIEQRKAELIGRHLRVTVLPVASPRKANTPAKQVSGSAKELVGFGAFKDALPSTEEYLREKHEETIREDQPLKSEIMTRFGPPAACK